MSDDIKITFVGDLVCLKEQSVACLRKYQRYNYDEIFEGVLNLFRSSDFVAGNLETPVAGELAGYTSTATLFNTPDEFLDSVKRAGFTFLSTANNHCLDKGVDGLKHTLDQLRQRGFDTSGTYKTKRESDQIFVREINGMRFAFLCFTYGTNSDATGIYLDDADTWMVDLLRRQERKTGVEAKTNPRFLRLRRHIPSPVKRVLRRLLSIGKSPSCLGPQSIMDNVMPSEIGRPEHEPYLMRLAQKIRNAKSEADIVIVMPHMGGQFNPAPGPYTKYIMKTLVTLGVDVVVAGHAHTSHLCQCFPNGVIGAYSLGNFCFTPEVGYFVPNTLAEYGIVLNIFFDRTHKKMTNVTFSVIKSIVDQHGYSRCVSVPDLLDNKMSDEMRNVLIADNEAVVNRFNGSKGPVEVSLEYDFARNESGEDDVF
jgi:poly-gamma-glutamate synthesis protein (capsule biosynthesis protein)